MGSMNAMGHLLAVGAGGSTDELFDFLEELSERYAQGRGADDPGMQGPMIHGFAPGTRAEAAASCGHTAPRWCVHPSRMVEVELRDDNLREAILKACMWLARELPQDAPWRRD